MKLIIQIVGSCEGRDFTDAEHLVEHAKEIVRAVNCYPDLLSALERATWIIRQAVGERTDSDYKVDWDAVDGPELRDIQATSDKAKK